MSETDPFIAEILRSREPDFWNKRWSQVGRFGGGMAVELEVGEFLHSLVRTVKPTVVIETGTHKGFSALMIARAMKQNGYGHLYTIDKQDYNVAADFNAFTLSDFVTFIHSDSIVALKDLCGRLEAVDILWLDSDHELKTVLSELEAATPLLKSGSYIAFHDTISFPSEGEAVERIRQAHPAWEYLRLQSARGLDLMRIP